MLKVERRFRDSYGLSTMPCKHRYRVFAVIVTLKIIMFQRLDTLLVTPFPLNEII